MMKELRQECMEKTPAEIIECIIGRVKYKEYLLDGTVEGESRYENVQELIGAASRVENVEEFLEQVALVQEIENQVDKEQSGRAEFPGALTLMTMHASKGLEFPVVFLVGMEEGVFPHSRAFTEKNELEEERRLAYVAMTRAKDRLYLLHAFERRLFGLLQSNPTSRFIHEIPEELREKI